MILTLPYDIKWSIANYINDVDIRRYFNIYEKINVDKFNILNRTIRKNMGLNRYLLKQNHILMRTNFHQNYEKHDDVTICNDLMDIIINITDTKVYYKLYIFKLKKKPYQTYSNSDDIYYKGSLEEDYYWHSVKIEYEKY